MLLRESSWKHRYSGFPDRPPMPSTDNTRIFSSPVVADGKVLFGLSTDGQSGARGDVVAADLQTGDPAWEYQTDESVTGKILDNGCGNVWSSGSLIPSAGLVVFDEADCDFFDSPPTSESVFALHIATGTLAWRYRPVLPSYPCDWDFGSVAEHRARPRGESDVPGGGLKGRHRLLLEPADRRPTEDQRGLRRILRGVHRHRRLRRIPGHRVHRHWGFRAFRDRGPALRPEQSS